MYLYFKNSKGNKRLINSNIVDVDNAMEEIKKYVNKLNPKFQIHYVRIWGNNPITFDVGSHTEFFLLYEKEIEC